MDRATIEGTLLQAMKSFFTGEGFTKTLKGQRTYLRPGKIKEDRVLPAPIQIAPGEPWTLALLFKIRFPQVEDLLNQCEPERRRLKPRAQKHSCTVALYSINLRRNDLSHPEATDVSAIQPALPALEQIYREGGAPLFERLQTLDDLLVLLDSEEAVRLIPANRMLLKVCALASAGRFADSLAAVMESRRANPGAPSMAFLRNFAKAVPELDLDAARLEQIREQTPLPTGD